jgi:hypothetical protein
MIRIKLLESPSYEGTKTLDGNVYRLRFWWDTLSAGWFMGLKGITNTLEISPIALLPGKDLLRCYGYRDILGSLWLVDTSGADEDPTYVGMGSRWELQYTPLGG